MNDTLGKIVAILIAVVVMFFAPFLYFAQQQENVMQTYVNSETKEFVDDIRTFGYISPSMYLRFTDKLDVTGNLYDIKIIHQHLVVDAEYNGSTFTGNYIEYFDNTYNEAIMEVLFPNNTLSIDSKERVYHFDKEDFVSVVATQKNRSLADKMYSFLVPNYETIYREARSGGMIRDVQIIN